MEATTNMSEVHRSSLNFSRQGLGALAPINQPLDILNNVTEVVF